MNTRPAPRRRTDQRSDQDRIAAMTSEQRQAAYLFRLSTDVRAACCAFLRSRGLPTGDDLSWRGINMRLRDSNAPSGATAGKGEVLDPRGVAQNFTPF